MGYKFIDEVKILVRSGKGGPGCVSFHREKHVERGGPDGGSGGRGADVIIQADGQLSTLLDYRFQPRHIAKNGLPGEGRSKTGRDGPPVILKVPVGTVVFDRDGDLQLADLDHDGAQFIAARGGRGGKGNEHFKSSTRQTPRFAQPGEPGEEKNLRLELKLLADVGLVGFPNVGKSSLIARISAARPKIADYPFTTLVPNLGVVKFGDAQHYVVADVPGLIVDAHKGAGLGTRFLRHVERVSHIVHLVTLFPEDPQRNPIADYEAIEHELQQHNPALGALSRVLVLNRIDLPEVRAEIKTLQNFARERKLAFFPISAVTGEGVQDLVKHLGRAVEQRKRAELE